MHDLNSKYSEVEKMLKFRRKTAKSGKTWKFVSKKLFKKNLIGTYWEIFDMLCIPLGTINWQNLSEIEVGHLCKP